ncbi:Major facilitator superfamily MFS_1 [Methylocella tundrae]|uniref:Major facilitator superfamily MFS_1 n=1 Tax=Methylocella tundrae TaxID=227605 RepID=A0A4U8Z5F5_METTU|nr:MFS transporter [Methylocella tundrae]WPP04387.1 MFS transporter [Methylocella tundrae]VFU10739.1 Major facilitator superfamily MFS_1 [Methylocella tundrae]VTZ49664.1 Major facilitator superfamily MFS_1 [Methylocella tundrae]
MGALRGASDAPIAPESEDRAIRAGFIDARARREYFQLALAAFLVSFMYSHAALLAVVFAREGFDLHTVGLLLSLYAFPVILFTFLSGAVAARIGVLNTCRVSVALMVVGFFSLRYTAGAFWPALASRLVQGVGQGLLLSSFVTYGQSRLNARKFVYLNGLFSSMFAVAQAFAPPFGAFILNKFGAPAMFLEGAIPACLGLALTFGVRPIPRPRQARALNFLGGLRRSRIPAFFAVFVNGTMFGFTAAYLAALLQAKALPIGAFFFASTTTLFASRFLAMGIFESLDRRVLVAGGFLAQGAGFVLLAYAGQSWLIVVSGVLFGIGYSVVYPVLSAWMSEGVEPAERAGPQALLNTAFNIGIFLMPYPQALLIGAFGYGATAMFLAALAIFAALAMFALRFFPGEA